MVNTRPNRAREVMVLPEDHPDREALDNWILYLRSAGRTEPTINAFLWRIQSFALTVPSLLEATTEDMIRYIADRRTTNAAETRRAIRTCFRSFYRWATRTKRIAEDPALDLPSVNVPRKVSRIAPDLDLQYALAEATTPERAMVLLARDACLRLGELTELHTDHREGNALRVLGKGEHTRIVPLSAELLDTLLQLEHTQGPGYYFPSRTGGPMHRQSVHKIIKRVTGWHPHALRHAGATAAFKGTGDLRAVQELLGHASIATTQRYVHVGEEEVRRAANAAALLPLETTGDIVHATDRFRRAS